MAATSMADADSKPRKGERGWAIGAAAALSIVTYFGARGALELETLSTFWRIAAAVAPVPFFGWLLLALVVGARDLDEMQRRMHLEALATSFGFVFLMLLTLGLVELAVPLNRDDWSYRHVWQMQAVTYLASLILTYRRYGVTNP